MTRQEAFKKMKESHAKYEDAIALIRVDNCYETYDMDATFLHQICGLVLANCNDDGITLVSGFPRHLLDIYLPKIVRAGFRLAIYE